MARVSGFAGAIALGLCCFMPDASAKDNFTCDAGANERALAITIDAKAGTGSFIGLGRDVQLKPEGEGRWVNPAAAITFLPGDEPPAAIVGFQQFECLEAASDPAIARIGGTAVDKPGRALGGNMRRGPGASHTRMQSVRGGTPLMILSNAKVSYQGFDWFRIKLANGRIGFIWGGILCSEGEQVEGLRRACDGASKPAEAKADIIYQVFAIGPDGRFGRGKAAGQDAAEAAAMQYCGSPQCEVQNVTTRKCHALSFAGGIAFFGAADSSDSAVKRAFDACKKSGAKNCQVIFSGCR